MSKNFIQSINENIVDICDINDDILSLNSINDIIDLEQSKRKIKQITIDRSKQVIITPEQISELFDSNNIHQEKFNKIILKNILEFSIDPFIILKFLEKFLNPDGLFLIVFPNISFFKERIKFLNGNFLNFEQISNRNLQYYFSISTILQFFLNLEYSIEKINRIEKSIKVDDYSDLNGFSISDELLDSIKRDPESKVSHYIFLTKPSSIKNPDMKKWLFEFSDNMTTDRLKEWFDYYKYYLSNNNSDFQHEEQIKEKNQSIIELQSKINSIENSFTWKLLQKLDKFKQFQDKS